MTKPDDEPLRELLTRLAVAPADEEAWSQLYRQMWPFVLGIVYRRLRGLSGVAEDLTQDTFIRLFRARPFARLRDPSSFRAYLARIAQNTTSTYVRQVLTIQNIAKSSEFRQEASPQISESEIPNDTIEQKDIVRVLKEELRPVEKELLELVLSGLSISEIAKTLGTTYSATAVRLYRLRQRLKFS